MQTACAHVLQPQRGAHARTGQACLPKWRRRDAAKHLEGEKRRRRARMGRLESVRKLLATFDSDEDPNEPKTVPRAPGTRSGAESGARDCSCPRR